MKITNTDRGVIVMGDVWDFDMWKAQKAWDLAMRIIPGNPLPQGPWTESGYLGKVQEELKKAYDVVNTVFKPSD